VTFRTIVVPLDGSQFGEYALPHALSLARRAGARLELVHVHVPPVQFSSADIYLPIPDGEEEASRAQAASYLNDVTARVKAASPTIAVNSTLLEVPVADSLCAFISQSGADLVALTTHGRGPVSRFWLGSVATELIQRAPAPVLLIRPGEGPSDLAADIAPRRILIPLDGSTFGEQILPVALTVGTLTRAEYRLLRVVPPILTSSSIGFGNRREVPTVADQLRAEAYGYMKDLTIRIPGLSAAHFHVAVDWPPAGAILADVDSSGIDLIALETRGRGGLAKLFLGSVADKVVRGANVPVLLQRPTGG
jgi:nucleotide-binding universal stress UspA family protein